MALERHLIRCAELGLQAAVRVGELVPAGSAVEEEPDHFTELVGLAVQASQVLRVRAAAVLAALEAVGLIQALGLVGVAYLTAVPPPELAAAAVAGQVVRGNTP